MCDELPPALADAVGERLAAAGVQQLWRHQRTALDHLAAGRNVVVATGTASGKSLVYQCAALHAVTAAPRATVIYLAPTKALAHDQARALAWTGLRIGVLDGDTPADEREWIATHAQVVLTNPDMLNVSVLPRHDRWTRLLRRLALVVIDECHIYRGAFGSHTAFVVRRLLRLARLRGAAPLVVAASATTADPAATVAALTGTEVVAVTDDGSPRGPVDVIFRDPAADASAARSSTRGEVVACAAELAAAGLRTLVFVPSRAGAERVAAQVREATAGRVDPRAVCAYRAGLLAEERRDVEAGLRDGSLRVVATTNALELGVDITGLDAVVISGWPGRASSFWQQVGRAGRDGRPAVAVLVANANPLDQYLLAHPTEIFAGPNDRTVIDVGNPHVLKRQLVAAAAESPVTPADLDLFGPAAPTVAAELVAEQVLRSRPRGLFWASTTPPPAITDIRSVGGTGVGIVEVGTGRLLGTVDGSAAHATVHTGAVYVHQGNYFDVVEFDAEAHVAHVTATTDEFFTVAASDRSIDVLGVAAEAGLGAAVLRRGSIALTSRVRGYQRRRTATGELLSTHPLDSPPAVLTTAAVWWSWPDDVVDAAGVVDVPGAVHAAEHAAIGLLPLVAPCDRWDIGGLSTTYHPATGEATVFIYDGYPGGAGYTARGFDCAASWLQATAQAIAGCRCRDGCPSCVQSPKCGNGNDPLDKAGALALLTAMVGPLG